VKLHAETQDSRRELVRGDSNGICARRSSARAATEPSTRFGCGARRQVPGAVPLSEAGPHGTGARPGQGHKTDASMRSCGQKCRRARFRGAPAARRLGETGGRAMEAGGPPRGWRWGATAGSSGRAGPRAGIRSDLDEKGPGSRSTPAAASLLGEGICLHSFAHTHARVCLSFLSRCVSLWTMSPFPPWSRPECARRLCLLARVQIIHVY